MILVSYKKQWEGGVSGGKDPWESLEGDGRKLFEEMQYICSKYGTGRWLQRRKKAGGRRSGRPWLDKGPKHHRRRKNCNHETTKSIILEK
jgi:hypothetical protein